MKIENMKIENKKLNISKKNQKYQLLLFIFIGLFVVYFSYLAIFRYQSLNSHYYDLGIMNQVVYNTSRGRFLEMTDQTLRRNVNRLAVHFDPILAFFAPFYWFYPSPDVLLVAQTIIVSLGAWAVYLISQKLLKNNLISLIFSLCYLLYFPVQRMLLFDFHPVSLSSTFFLFALYFSILKKYHLYFLFIFLALLTKEHVGLTVFLLGGYFFLVKKEKKIGLITSITGLIFFVITVYFIIPYFRGESHFAASYFANIKLRLPTIVKEGFFYTEKLLLPNFYAIFSPFTLLIASPEWLINIFSINNNMRAIFYHYNSVIVPFIFYSLILGYKNFNLLVRNEKIKWLFFIIFIIFNLRSIYLYNPVPSFVKEPVKYQKIDKITASTIKLWQKTLKDETIKVSTTPKLAPFFTNRQYYHNFLFDPAYTSMGKTDDDIIRTIDDYKGNDYIIIYRPEIGDISKGGLTVEFYQRLRNDNNYQMIFSNNLNEKGIEVYKKNLEFN